MPLPVVSLSSLASRAVLTHNLDTRELPLHLHRDIEQYKRRQGAFNLLSTDFVIERVDGKEPSQEEREYALDSFLKSPEGEVIMKFDVVVAKQGDNKWSITKVGPRTTTVHLQDPVKIFHNISKTMSHTSYKTNYLNNGKLLVVETEEQLNNGEVVEVNSCSYEVDLEGRLTWMGKWEEPLRELVTTFTARGRRAQEFGDCNVFIGDEDFKASVLSKRVPSQSQLSGLSIIPSVNSAPS